MPKPILTAEQIADEEINNTRRIISGAYSERRKYQRLESSFLKSNSVVESRIAELNSKIKECNEQAYLLTHEELQHSTTPERKKQIEEEFIVLAAKKQGYELAIKKIENPVGTNDDTTAKALYAKEILTELGKYKRDKTTLELMGKVKDLSLHPDLDFKAFCKQVDDITPTDKKYFALKLKTSLQIPVASMMGATTYVEQSKLSQKAPVPTPSPGLAFKDIQEGMRSAARALKGKLHFMEESGKKASEKTKDTPQQDDPTAGKGM